MEQAPRLDDHELESDQPLNLLQELGDLEVTLFNHTAPLSQQVDKCPVDLSDPRVTVEMINTFVVKAVNKNGLEIDEKYVPVFTEILTAKGIEPNFSVARSDTVETKENVPLDSFAEAGQTAQTHEKRAATQSEMAVRGTASVVQAVGESGLKRAVEVVDSIGLQPLQAERIAAGSLVERAEASEEYMEPVRVSEVANQASPATGIVEEKRAEPGLETAVEGIGITASASMEIPEIMVRGLLENESELEAAESATGAPVVVDTERYVGTVPIKQVLTARSSQLELNVKDIALEAVPDEGVMAMDTTLLELELPDGQPARPAEDMTIREAGDIPSLSEVLYIEAPGVQQAWLAELDKPPEVLLDDFTEALQLWAEQVEFAPPDTIEELDADTPQVPGSLELSSEGLNEAAAAELPPQPSAAESLLAAAPIVALVAERLGNLEVSAKEEAGELVKTIAGAVHGLHVLQERGAGPEALAEVQEYIEKVCIELFEAIGIEYDEEMVRQFAAVISRADFRPGGKLSETARTLTPAIDLARDGTHEAKYFDALSDDSAAVSGGKLEQTLGVFAVYVSATRRVVAGLSGVAV